jgi:peptide deformylase
MSALFTERCRTLVRRHPRKMIQRMHEQIKNAPEIPDASKKRILQTMRKHAFDKKAAKIAAKKVGFPARS